MTNAIRPLEVVPDRYLPHRYAGAAEDFNPIHVDAEHARSVGQPGNILHGLYTMGLAARAVLDAADGDPRALRRMSVQFRAPGFPERAIEIAGTVRERDGDAATVELHVEQDGVSLLRNAVAVVTLGDG